MMGTTRGVLRSARPAAVSLANHLNTRPYTLGSSYGQAPTPTTVPTTTSSGEVAPGDASGRRPPAHKREHRHREARDDHGVAVEVGRRLVDRVPEPVVPVEEPVAEPAQHVVGIGRRRDTVRRFSVSWSTGRPYAPCEPEADDPPQRHPDGRAAPMRPAAAQRRAAAARPRQSLEDEPQRGCDARRAASDDALTPPTARSDEREERGIAPSARPHRRAS